MIKIVKGIALTCAKSGEEVIVKIEKDNINDKEELIKNG